MEKEFKLTLLQESILNLIYCCGENAKNNRHLINIIGAANFLKECCTLKIQVPRRSGITTLVKYLKENNPNKFIIFDCLRNIINPNIFFRGRILDKEYIVFDNSFNIKNISTLYENIMYSILPNTYSNIILLNPDK